ncbi:MAG: mechanosensitive ion channel domain-containing protein [Haloarculaceae archaeon]
MVDWTTLLTPNLQFALALAVLVLGVVVGLVLGRLTRRVLSALGVDDAVEGTTFERRLRGLGTSTVGLFAGLVAWFVYGVAVVVALQVAQLLTVDLFWIRATGFLPNLFLAAAALVVGFVLGDKAELTVSEYLRGIKLPEIGILPRIVKYSIVYIAALVALGQVGVATDALLVLLGMYIAAAIVLLALALRDVLPAGAAGIYLLLNQPFGIGDTVEIGARRGVVQEVQVFVTHVESEDEEYIVPNHLVLREGAIRVR